MSWQTEDRCTDVEFWGLSRAQAARYWARISTYHARRSRYWADRSVQYATRGRRLSMVSLIMALLAFALLALDAAL